jgi:hypothetical protein
MMGPNTIPAVKEISVKVQCRADMGVGSFDGEVSPEGVHIIVISVSWVHKGPLGANTNAVLLLLGLLVVQCGCAIAAVGCDCGPGPGRRHWWGILNPCSQRFHLLMELFVLFLKNALVVFNLLKFILGSCGGRGLATDDVLQRADEFPHLLSGDPSGGVRWCEGIATPGSFLFLREHAGSVYICCVLELFLRDARDGVLGVCGKGLGPSRRWVRHRFGDGSRSVHNVKVCIAVLSTPTFLLSLDCVNPA